MKLLILIIISTLLFVSCNKLFVSDLNTEVKALSKTEIESRYNAICKRTVTKAHTLVGEDYNIIGDYLQERLEDSIFTYWYGTPWNYNGITQVPQHGAIACGYFVTTVLKHNGFKIKRAKLAQQASSEIVNTFCDKSSITTFSNNNYLKLKEHVLSKQNALYILGLDNHVVFVSVSEGIAHVIHSGPPGVKKQKLDMCRAVVKSKYHYIGCLSCNKIVLNKWVNNETIKLQLN